MRKAALLYNPDSGGSRRRRWELDSALHILREAGVEAELLPAESKDHAGEEVQRAIAAGCDTIIACGGDGTIHNIIQVLANTPVALGVLPMGTANALAYDIGLPMNVPAAAKALLRSAPRRIALGRVEYGDSRGNRASRFFVVAAGVGVDAHLFYKLHSGEKKRLGMTAYYAKAWNLWFTYEMTRFVAEFDAVGTEGMRQAEVTELMSIRIRNFGGVVQELAPGASLDRDDIRVVMARTASRLAYLAYVARGMLKRNWNIPGIDLVYSLRIVCRPKNEASQDSRRIYIEADGELLGTIPAEITIVPQALTLLTPSK
jgi:diacylglycerol kinase (ATP)